MQERMVKVDGKEIKESEMPEYCFMIQGEWYTEKGLPKELRAYKRLWTEARAAKSLDEPSEKSKKGESKKTTTPTEQPSDPTTATAADATTEKK